MKAIRTRQAPPPTAEAKPAPSLRVAREDDSATQSQAMALQSYLEAELSGRELPRRLPLGVSLPLIVAASGGLWVAIIAGVRALSG